MNLGKRHQSPPLPILARRQKECVVGGKGQEREGLYTHDSTIGCEKYARRNQRHQISYERLSERVTHCVMWIMKLIFLEKDIVWLMLCFSNKCVMIMLWRKFKRATIEFIRSRFLQPKAPTKRQGYFHNIRNILIVFVRESPIHTHL
jgi:hypothetical protein